MEYEFSFYDLVGYLVPGTLTVILGFWFLSAFCALEFRIPPDSILVLAALLAVCYCVGNLVQAIGNRMEGGLEERWGGKFADQFLQDPPPAVAVVSHWWENLWPRRRKVRDPFYTQEFRNLLKRRIEDTFKITFIPSTPNDSNEQKKLQSRQRWQAFHLCYALIAEAHSGQRAAIFQGLYALYRGVLATAWVGVFVCLLIGLKHVSLWLLMTSGTYLPTGAFFVFDSVQVAVSGILLFVLLVAVGLLRQRMRRFSEHYVNAVYQSFYAWSVSHKP